MIDIASLDSNSFTVLLLPALQEFASDDVALLFRILLWICSESAIRFFASG